MERVAMASAPHHAPPHHAPLYEPVHEPADILGGLYGDGIIALPGAFGTDFADRLHAEIMALFTEAQGIAGGALPRGPQRWYVEGQPERISGFVEIVTHPWFVAVCEAVLTRDYRIVEVGFDIPFPVRRTSRGTATSPCRKRRRATGG